MNDFEKYMLFQYKPGARGEDGFIDCWGLTRLIRHEVYGHPMLPSWAEARYSRPGSVDDAYQRQTRNMVEVKARPGAVAMVLRRGVCIHVALVIDDKSVIDISRKGSRPRITKLSDWLRDYPAPLWRVVYYCENTQP